MTFIGWGVTRLRWFNAAYTFVFACFWTVEGGVTFGTDDLGWSTFCFLFALYFCLACARQFEP